MPREACQSRRCSGSARDMGSTGAMGR
jgi:hypothetical protein